MPAPSPVALLSDDHIALMARGVSVIAASRDARNKPSIMRAVGSHVSADGTQITVYLSRPQSHQLIQDVTATGMLAVVFSEPSSHRSIQVKGVAAVIRDGTTSDQPILARYLASMEHELGRIGYPPIYAHAMLRHHPDDLVAISFTPAAAFDQTPGPKAGAALPNLSGAIP